MSRHFPRLLGAIALAVLAIVAGAPSARADSDALWKIVHDHCVPDQQQHGSPAPCALVDLKEGFILLKDITGATQYLAIPTAKVTGIEDPALLQPNTPNYFAEAWTERSYTEHAAGRALPLHALSLAVNSPPARSQNQLHIHIDCLRPAVRASLLRQAASVGDDWAPLKQTLRGHHYWAMRVLGDDLGTADPFKLLADKRQGAAAAMGRHTLVVVGADFAGKPGFLLLDDTADLATGDRAGGEELQDHTCALAKR